MPECCQNAESEIEQMERVQRSLNDEIDRLRSENNKLHLEKGPLINAVGASQAVADGLQMEVDRLRAENAELVACLELARREMNNAIDNEDFEATDMIAAVDRIDACLDKAKQEGGEL